MNRTRFLFKALPFKRKLAFYSILISTIPVLLVGLLASSIAAKSIQEEVNLNHQALLKQIEYRLTHLMENLNMHSVTIATNVTVERSVESLRKQVNYSPIRYDVSVIYKKFDHVYSSVHQSTPFSRSVYETIMQNTRTNRNAPFIVTPNTYNNKDLMLFRPIPIYSYYTEGIVALNVSVDELSKVLDDSGSKMPILISTVAEINGVVDPYLGSRHPQFILSSMARGGFSGGVAILEYGLALGVITESLVSDHKPAELGYFSVLTVEPILSCLAHHKVMSRDFLGVVWFRRISLG